MTNYDKYPKKYVKLIGKTDQKEFNNIRNFVDDKLKKTILDSYNEVRASCIFEKVSEIGKKYKGNWKKISNEIKKNKMKNLNWNLELYDYAYFSSKAQGDYCEPHYTPVWKYISNTNETMNYKLITGLNNKNDVSQEKFIEDTIDTFSSEGHNNYRHWLKFEEMKGGDKSFKLEQNFWKIPNNYTTITEKNIDQIACEIGRAHV